ncbi:MAG: hypothetical protein RIM99_15925 [Cyclobacteriaceae bacterium]
MRNSKKILLGKSIFIAALITIGATLIIVYLTGRPSHRSILENSFISLSVLASVLFLFLAAGLYNGLNVFDNLGHKLKVAWRKPQSPITDNLHWLSNSSSGGSSLPDVGEGIEGILLSILLWIGITILAIVLIVFLEVFVWASVLLLLAIIYWVMIRALKLIFSKSQECMDDLPKSVFYALGYTILYSGWIYAVIYASTLF